MATAPTKKLKYKWSNGSYHSRAQHGAPKAPGKTAYAPQGATTKPALSKLTLPGGKPLPPVQPLDPNVVNQQVISNRDIATGDLYGTWQQGNLDQQYGFGAGGASNPYSEAAKIQENYKRSVLGTTGSYGASGQYNSGAYGRAQNENARNYDMAYDSARRGYDQATGNLAFDKLQRYANAGTSLDQSKFDALLKSLGGL